MYAPEARKLIKAMVKWIPGKEFNRGTFDKCVERGLLPCLVKERNKAAIFDKAEVVRFASLFPPVKPPDKHGIINSLAEIIEKKRPKNRAKGKR